MEVENAMAGGIAIIFVVETTMMTVGDATLVREKEGGEVELG